ncbi:MAG TPA: class I SAM-dependent methyltransferase [Gemmatimonadales bacterium]|nr:class I SAM-dependent methyltransferase [Gemmatimonadales bacterium]
MTRLAILILAVLLAITTREWLVLRARQRQRGLLRRWPIRKVSVEELDPRFQPDDLGATRATEVTYVGRGTIRVPGGTSDTEAWILAVLAKDAQRLFEFGTCTGKTAYLWARNQPPGGTVTTLTLAPHQLDAYQSVTGDDRTAEAYARQESQFTRFLYSGTEVEGRVVQLYGDSKRFDEIPYAGVCDVVFVDGSHAYSYVVSDTEKALRMVRPGGLVLWHDYSPDCPGVFRALNRLTRRLPLVHIQGTTLVAYRNGNVTAAGNR